VPATTCFFFSHYADVTFKATLTDPDGKAIKVPRPAQDIRVSYCPVKAGKYKLEVEPSTRDHFAHASVDCSRAAQLRAGFGR
jgi:hypothetical protein